MKGVRFMEIKRDLYLNEMIIRLYNGMIKVITGIRRCGKSYLMNTLFYRYLLEAVTDEMHIVRFAFDSAEDLKRIGEDPVALMREKRKVSPESLWIISAIIFRMRALSLFCWMRSRNWIVSKRC